MEKKVTRLYQLIMFIGILISIYVAVFINNKITDIDAAQPIENWSTHLTYSDKEDIYVYHTILPQHDIADKVIAVYLSHTEMDVIVDDTLIYSVKKAENPTIRTTGYSWNFIPMHESYAGHPVTIRLKSTYESSPADAIIYYGQYNRVQNFIISDNLIRTIVAFCMILIGCVSLIYSVFIIGRSHTENSLLHFSFFTLLLGIWVFADSSFCAFILPWSVAHVFFTHVSLMLMPIPFLLFLKSTYQDKTHPLWTVPCVINCVIVIIRILLQLTGLSDFKETLWMTHIFLILFVVIGVYLSVRELILNKITKQMSINALCVCLIMFTTVLDLIHYTLTHKSGSYGAIGFLLYTFIMGINTIKNSHKMLERAKENEVYRRLAYTDELTGLFNRTAFKQDFENQQLAEVKANKYSVSPTAIFMLDLNDLKKCNDNYGHEYGDRYISIASNIINQVFGTDGRCYRIGGDEFCVILPFTSDNDISNKLESLRRHLKEQNKKAFVVPVAIAVGYAVYDPAIDSTLADTRNRADSLMYQDKKRQKEIGFAKS